MTFDWQLVAALALVGIAAVYVAWQFWKSMAAEEGAGCGTCPKSPAENAPRQKPLIEVGDLLNGHKKK